MLYEKYIGIPFKANGRTEEGLDCWGLTRLIYSREYSIQLPSFSGDYVIEDDQRIQELISQYKEGWESKDPPSEGDIVLFRILGELTHIGVMISTTQFIHVREGSNTVIDSITNTKWKNRVIGFYKYVENSGAVLNAVPHPLKTERITTYIPEGTTLEEVYSKIIVDSSIDPTISKTAVIMVNGIPIPRTLWNTTIIKTTDVVEFRSVPGKEAIKIVAIAVLAFYAPTLIAGLELAAGVSGLTAAGANLAGVVSAGSLTVAGTIAAASLVVAGSYLVNAIAPVRPPSSTDPGSPEQQNLITGANNIFNPYGSIPVVLGKSRITAPLGARSFITYPEERESYLHMLLVWGYGPLTLTDFRIGEVDWNEFQFNTELAGGRITFDRKTAISQTDQDNFDKIYGNDVDQQFSNIELIGPEWTQITSGSAGVATVVTNSGSTVVFDILTGLISNPPPDIIDEVVPVATAPQ